ALTKMKACNAGYMMVGQDGIPQGFISKSDLTAALSPYLRPAFSKWHRPLDDATLKIKVKCIMRKPVYTVRPETPLEATMEDMLQLRSRCLPVADQQGKIHGLVTASDIFKALLNNKQAT
ncbi:MAG: CBS domain-containing protein, partial [Planctomycetota bacterium]